MTTDIAAMQLRWRQVAGAGRALPWVFCGFSPWSDSSLAEPFGTGAGAFCAGCEAARICKPADEGAEYLVAGARFGGCLRPAYYTSRDAKGGIQAASSTVSDAEAGAISGGDSAAASGSGDLSRNLSEKGTGLQSVPRGTSHG